MSCARIASIARHPFCPFDLSVDVIGRMLNLEIADHPQYSGVGVQEFDDATQGSTRANQLAWEVECLVEAGLEPWEALAAATWRGGRVMGIPEAGIVREGGPADLVLVHGDPLSDPTALWRIWRVA